MDYSCNHDSTSTNLPSKKKRKVGEKRVVRVKIEAKKGDEEEKQARVPSDSWSWRKYGQKAIKGSPYPRGYYRCSTAKGCSARKQIERCKEDDSVFIITYTFDHNHPGPGSGSGSKSTVPPHTTHPPKKKARQQISTSKPISAQQPLNMHSPGEPEKLEPYLVTLDSFTPANSFDIPPLVDKQPKDYDTSRIIQESYDYDFFDALDELGSFSTSPAFSSLSNNNNSNTTISTSPTIHDTTNNNKNNNGRSLSSHASQSIVFSWVGKMG